MVHPTALIPMTLSQCEGKGGLTQGKRVRHHNHFSSHIHYISRESRREMYTGHGRLCVCLCVCVCVCLSIAAFPYYCTDPDVSWGNRVPSSCALLGGFAVGAWVSLL